MIPERERMLLEQIEALTRENGELRARLPIMTNDAERAFRRMTKVIRRHVMIRRLRQALFWAALTLAGAGGLYLWWVLL